MKKKGISWKRHLAALLSGLIITGAASGMLTTAAYAAETENEEQTQISTLDTTTPEIPAAEDDQEEPETEENQKTEEEEQNTSSEASSEAPAESSEPASGTGTGSGTETTGGETVTVQEGYAVTAAESGLTCTYNGEAVTSTVLALVENNGVYTVVPPVTTGCVIWSFDKNGTGTAVTGKKILNITFEGQKYRCYVVNGRIPTADKAYYINYNGKLNKVGKTGEAVFAKKTGVFLKKYFKAGKVATASKSYCILYNKCVYKVTKTGAAAKDTSSKSGTHQRLISGICYKVSNKTAKYALFTGMYGKKCYTKGELTSGWQKIGKKKYYCKSGVPVTGRKKISKKWYFFTASGALAVKDTTENKVTYYLDASKYLEAYKKSGVYYRANGKKMTTAQKEMYVTLLRARKVVNKVTTSDMSKAKKLKTCFNYVKTAYRESRPRTPHYNGIDWPVLYANDMFVRGTGNCFSYAACFAYLAKAIGYDNVYACNSGGHGWAEINGLVYDPEWSIHYHSYSYYGLSYNASTDVNYKAGIAGGLPWMHVKIGF